MKNKKPITPEAFVRSWQKHHSIKAVAAELGITHHAANMRAYKMRQRGVNLKRMGHLAHELRNADVDSLNKMIQETPKDATP